MESADWDGLDVRNRALASAACDVVPVYPKESLDGKTRKKFRNFSQS